MLPLQGANSSGKAPALGSRPHRFYAQQIERQEIMGFAANAATIL